MPLCNGIPLDSVVFASPMVIPSVFDGVPYSQFDSDPYVSHSQVILPFLSPESSPSGLEVSSTSCGRDYPIEIRKSFQFLSSIPVQKLKKTLSAYFLHSSFDLGFFLAFAGEFPGQKTNISPPGEVQPSSQSPY